MAKPVIDIAARADGLEVVAGKDSLLALLGFVHEPPGRRAAGPPNRHTDTRVVDGLVTHNLHVFPSTDWDELNQRILRAHPHASPAAVQGYADLKRKPAAGSRLGDVSDPLAR
ncbi:hypothetical protein GCM10009744_23910 [Kribbella alba]|uniref:Uncharacterized protein n=1 Tax=Kribbella alba TaxID=190197 RepID=A0ABP4R3B1_9ACTN